MKSTTKTKDNSTTGFIMKFLLILILTLTLNIGTSSAGDPWYNVTCSKGDFKSKKGGKKVHCKYKKKVTETKDAGCYAMGYKRVKKGSQHNCAFGTAGKYYCCYKNIVGSANYQKLGCPGIGYKLNHNTKNYKNACKKTRDKTMSAKPIIK